MKDVTGVGVNLQAGNNINIKSSGKVYIGTAVGYNTTTTTTTSKGGWFSGGSTTTTSTSIPVFLQSELKAKRIGINSQSIHIKGLKIKVDSLKFKAKEEIIFDSQTANMTQSVHTTSSSIFTKTSQGSGNSQEVEVKNDLNVNKITANQKIKFINTDWDKTKTEIISDYEEITKALKSDSYSYSKSSGLGSGKILPIIALAVSLACQQYQVGASFLSSLGASGTVLKMGVVGLSVLTTQAATNFIQTGDPVQTFKNLTSDRSLRQIAISVATAGVMDQVGGSLGLNVVDGSQSFVDHLKSSTIQGGIGTGINLVLSKDEPKDILKQGGLNIVANTVCGYGASKIGANLGDNPIVQTITHFISGGTAGYILDQSSKGFVSGAIGASVAKMTMSSLENLALEKRNELRAKGLSKKEVDEGVMEVLNKNLAISQISSATIASCLNLDMNIALQTGSVTAKNNCIASFIIRQLDEKEQYERLQEEEAKAHEEAVIKALIEEQRQFSEQEYINKAIADYKLLNKGILPSDNAILGYRKAFNQKYQLEVNRERLTGDLKTILSVVAPIRTILIDGVICGKSPALIAKDIIINKVTGSLFKAGALKTLEAAKNIAPKVNYGFNYQDSVFKQPTHWTSEVGTKQTYKVYQRKDIDWDMVRTAGDKKFIGLTNREAAIKFGKAPQLDDNYFATVHHIGQKSKGPLAETTTRIHDFKSKPLENGKKPFDIIHSQFGYRKKNPIDPVNHDIWKMEVKEYWKARANNVKQ